MDRYEEAMSRCKQWERKHTKGYVIQDMIEFIFPELAESDDERIRKATIEGLIRIAAEYKNPLIWGGRFSTDDVLAWLEKQKYEYEVFEPVESTLEYKIGFNAGKESIQKAEWSEEDENHFTACVRAMRTYNGNDTPISKWIEALKDRVCHQPHWKPSEEQMEALLRAVDDLQGKPYWGYINEVVYDIRDKLM